MSLNTAQREAVSSIEGPLLILAGAGSGKTTVLMKRISHMINSGISPHHLLALTFTNKAANEMRTRIIHHLPNEEMEKQLHLSTFHSFCLEVLNNERASLPLPHWKLATPGNALFLLKQIMPKTEVKPTSMMSYISVFKNEMLSANGFINEKDINPFIDWEKIKMAKSDIELKHLEAIEEVFPRFEKSMKDHSFYDFDDLLVQTVDLFLANPHVLEKYQDRFRYIMVDEYQDTNRAQYTIIKLLAAKHRNLAVVGDDFQSIYAFRGSDIRNILDFDRDYPEARIVKLEQNYRSTKIIVAAANSVIANNINQKKKTLFTENAGGNLIDLFELEDTVDEAYAIAKQIKGLTNDGYRFSDITVLFRSNAQSADLEEAFSKQKIPHRLLSGKGFWEREEIQDILRYLEFIENPHNLDAFDRCIRKPKRLIADATIRKIISKTTNELSVIDVLRSSNDIDRMQTKAKDDAKRFIDMIESLRDKRHIVSVLSIVSELLKLLDYEKTVLGGYDEGTRRDKLENIQKLKETISRMETVSGHKITIYDFLERVLLTSTEATDESSDAVNMMTIHASKGLEFPVVFVVGLNEGTFPSFYAQTPAAIEEERRLCYVAMTRAKERLFLSHAKKKWKRELEPSMFLSEIDDDLVKKAK